MKKQPFKIETCPMFNKPCRHVSMEHAVRPYTPLIKDPVTHLFKQGVAVRNCVFLGHFCNDAGKYIADMHFCPVMWAKYRYPITAPVKKRGRPRTKRFIKSSIA